MKTLLHKAESRGFFDHGWLQTHHTFSFADYYDPDRMHFGMLRVLNDDIIAPDMGFGTHPHDNMEIVSIPIHGALAHSDSKGHEQVILEDDVQVMSAGTGLYHSEYNHSETEPTNFLQLWIFPDAAGHTPRYEQKHFPKTGRKNTLQTIVSPEKNNGALWLNQDAWLHLADLDNGKSLDYRRHTPGNGVYLFVIEGQIKAGNETVDRRDGLGIWETDSFSIRANADSRILLVEVPMGQE